MCFFDISHLSWGVCLKDNDYMTPFQATDYSTSNPIKNEQTTLIGINAGMYIAFSFFFLQYQKQDERQ